MSIRVRRRLVPAAVLLALAGCTVPEAARPAEPATDPVRIGVLVPLSGPRAAAGRQEAHGAELAAELVNGDYAGVPLPLAGGKGFPRLGGARLKLTIADSRSGQEDGAEQAVQLVTSSDAHALVIGGVGNVGSEVSRRTERLRVPLVQSGGSESYLTDLGLDWYFRTSPTDRVIAEGALAALRHAALAGTTLRRVVVLYPAGREYAGLPAVIGETAGNAGITLAAAVTFPPGGDLDAAVGTVAAAQPDVVAALAVSTADAVEVTRALRGHGLPFVGAGAGFVAPDFARAAGSAAEGFLRAGAWSPDFATRNPTAAAVAALYQRRYGIPMTVLAAGTFTATLALAAAVDKAGAVDPARIRAALLSGETGAAQTIMPWVGIRFEPGGRNALAAGVVEQLIGGRFHLVHPPELATARLRWPPPSLSPGPDR